MSNAAHYRPFVATPLSLPFTEFDAITVESLYEAGHLKWTNFGPGRLGAFVAEMDYGTAPPITAALHAAVDRMIFGYLPPALGAALADACSAWQDQSYGWKVAPEDIHPLPDVIKGLEVAMDHFSRPGSPVILPVPAYMPFLMVPAAHGRETIQIEMVLSEGRYVYDLDALDAAYRAGGDLLVLCNPYNPLGRVMEPAEMLAICEVVNRHGGRVFSDEIHSALVYDGHRHVPYASLSDVAAGHTITAASASKAWNLPGLKCAQMLVTNDADRQRWIDMGPFAAHGASTLGVVANTVAYREGRPWLEGVLAYLDGNRVLLGELLGEHLPEVRYTAPEGTYLAWLDCRELKLGEATAEFFAEQASVVLTEGLRCGPQGAGFARLNFATTRPILTEIVTKMAEAVRRVGR